MARQPRPLRPIDPAPPALDVDEIAALAGPAPAGNGQMTTEQREEIIRLLRNGEELSPEWARVLFPPEKREYELVYYGKERAEDIIVTCPVFSDHG